MFTRANSLTKKWSSAAGHWQVKGWSHGGGKKREREKGIRRTFAGPSVGSAVCLSAGCHAGLQNERGKRQEKNKRV